MCWNAEGTSMPFFVYNISRLLHVLYRALISPRFKIHAHWVCHSTPLNNVSPLTIGWEKAKLFTHVLRGQSQHDIHVVFTPSDAGATIYFINQFCVASTWDWRLFESGIYLTQWTIFVNTRMKGLEHYIINSKLTCGDLVSVHVLFKY